MPRYTETVEADIRKRVSPPNLPSETRISEELRNLMVTLYNRRKAWREQGTVGIASEKETES